MQAMTSFFFNFECISKIGFFSFLLRTGGQPYLTVSADSFMFSSKLIRQDIKTASNTTRSIETNDSRLKLPDTTGTGIKNITITYESLRRKCNKKIAETK